MPNSAYHRALRQEISSMVDQLDLPELHKQAIRSRWLDQVLWMDQKADQCRRWHYRLRLTTIVGGVILPALVGLTFQVQNNPSLKTWLPIATFGLSQVIAVSAAMEEFCRFGDRWRQYRQTVESLKTEGWQFLQTSGAYAQHEDHVAGYPLFAARVESIITDDVKTYITEMVKQKVKEEEVVQQGVVAARQAAQRMTSSNLLTADRSQAAEFSTGRMRSTGSHPSASASANLTPIRFNGSDSAPSASYPANTVMADTVTASYVPDYGTDQSFTNHAASPVGLMTTAPVALHNSYASASFIPIKAVAGPIESAGMVATPTGTVLNLLYDTILKSRPEPAEQLSDSEKVLVKGGSMYALQACVLGENNHYCVTFSDVGFGLNLQTTWYVYAPHVNVVGKAVDQTNLQRLLEITGKNQGKIRLNVPFFQQVDNLHEPYRTCNTSSCAMVAKFLGAKISGDDDYYQIVQKYGDTTDHNAQTQALAELGVQSTWHTNLDYDELDHSLAAGLPIVIGILHRGPLEQPTGGHMLVVIGKSTNGNYICHDPFGSLLDDYTSDPNQGNGVTYPRSILDRRWLYEGKQSGWGRLFYGNTNVGR